jgi:hypothetical protein
VHAFRDHTEEGTRVDVVDRDVVIRSTRDDSGRPTVQTIHAALSGPLVRITVPHVKHLGVASGGLTDIRLRYRVCGA